MNVTNISGMVSAGQDLVMDGIGAVGVSLAVILAGFMAMYWGIKLYQWLKKGK